MSMSDCEKCWDTPCTCGWDYKNWSVSELTNQIKMLQSVLSFKLANPNIEFPYTSGPHTDNEKLFLNFMRKING